MWSMLDRKILDPFRCTECGECCRWTGSVLLNDGDISRLATHLAVSEQAFIDGHTRLAPSRIQLALLDQKDGSCSFLDGDRCSIYEARPEQCRTFPYAWNVSEGCPPLDALMAPGGRETAPKTRE
jgi:Fe-S-cluster containining protein